MLSASDSQRTALLLIDIQEAFTHPTYWGPSRSNPNFESNITSLLPTYRALLSATPPSSPSPHMIIHVAHSSLSSESPLHRTSPGFAFQSFATPLPVERVIDKHVNSAFIGTDLEEILRRHFDGKPGTLYIAGLTTDHCVSTTTRMAGNLGVCDGPHGGEKGKVIFIEDATAAWQKGEGGFEAEIVHQVNVESLREFATIDKTRNVLESWNKLVRELAGV